MVLTALLFIAQKPLLATDFRAGNAGWFISRGTNRLNSDGWEISVPAGLPNPWDVVVGAPIPAALPKGASVTLDIEAASADGGEIMAFIEEAKEPFVKLLSGRVALTGTFQRFRFTERMKEAYGPKQAQVSLHLASQARKLVIRSIRVTSDAPAAASTTDLIRFDRTFDLASWNPGGAHPPTLLSGDNPPTIRARFDNPGDPWGAQIGRPALAPVVIGDVVEVKFRARSSAGSNIFAVYEQAAVPNRKLIYQGVQLKPEWDEYRVARRADFNLPVGDSQFKFFFGGKGDAEIQEVTVRNLGAVDPQPNLDRLGTVTYRRDTALLRQAQANIERIRKGPLRLTLRSANGKPIGTGTARVRLVRHAFRFGSAVPATLINDPSETGVKFREIVAREFNTVTFENDLKWRDDSPSPVADAEKALPWLKSHRIEVRGHNLVWGGDEYLPRVLKSAPASERWSIVEAHVREYVNRMKGHLYVWDVVNEAVENTSLWKEMGWNRFGDTYKLVRRLDPQVQLAYNEYSIFKPEHRRVAIERVKTLQAQGAPIDLFGDQAHFDTFPPASSKAIYDGWTDVHQQTGLPIEVTEFDLATFRDELYRDFLTDTLIVAFGHPAVKSFIVWGFWEGAHWLAKDGGYLVRRDFTYRPAMTAFHDLVHKQWSTDVTVKPNATGTINVPAFYGTYEITVNGKKVEVEHLPGRTAPLVVNLK